MRITGIWASWIVVGLVACGTSERPTAATTGSGSAATPQTAKQAMELVCDVEARSNAAASAPADRDHVRIAWMREQVSNPEIKRVLDELALDVWPSARARLVALAAQHGVTACKLAEIVIAKTLPVDVPEVAGPAEPDTDAPLVVVSPAQITLDGASVVTLDKGHMAPADLERHVVKPLAAWRAKRPQTGRVRIAFDRTTPVETALAVIRSLAAGGKAEVAIVCMQNHEQVVLPVDMPLGGVDVWYVVTAGKDSLTLAPWTDGKAAAPIVTATLDGGLGQILRGLATRMAAGMGIATTVPLILVVDPSHDVNRLVGLLGGLRAMSSHVVLSPGSK